MNRRILWGIASTLALAVLPASAFGQAAAESALVKAGSAAVTAKTGSALNSALDRSSKQLAGRVQRQTSQPARGTKSQVQARRASTTPAPATAPPEGTPPAQGSMIASIQGAETSCAPTAPTASAPGSKTAAGPAQTNPSGQECAGKPAPQKHKSVITLSFSK